MNPRLPSRRRGFTLIEMMITLCVFLLLAGAIFSIFGATLESATTLQDNQSRADGAEALGAWLRQSLLSIPAQGVLVSYHREDRPFHVSGVIWGAGEQYAALDLQPQANGNYSLRYTFAQMDANTFPGARTGSAGYSAALQKFQTEVFGDDPALSWRVLMRDLKSADWRFLPANAVAWVDTATGGKPVLAEFQFQDAGSASPIVDDFWLPPLVPAALGITAPPVAAPQ